MPPQGSDYGLFLQQSGRCTISGNTIAATCFAGANIKLEHCWECTISGNTIVGSEGDNGIEAGLLQSTISGNTITTSSRGITGGFGECTISGNTITTSHGGITGDFWKCTISGNNLSSNDIGLTIYGSSYSVIVGNIISNNEMGIKWDDAGGICNNQFYHNNFDDNTILIEVSTYQPCGANMWDNSYPSGGNYWSAYTGLDAYSGPDQDQPGSDGIGDSPFMFDVIHDNYPLMTSWIEQPIDATEDLINELHDIIDDNPGTPLADKLEDAYEKTETAYEEMMKDPPDNQAAVGNLEGAVGDLEAAVKDGVVDTDEGRELMDRYASIAQQLAVVAINDAIARGGNQDTIDEAQTYLGEGITLREEEAFKDAINKYKDAVAKAESA
jgi:parallel beta-helix repeat protein